MTSPPTATAGPPPAPTDITTLDDVGAYLRRLRAWAGNVSYPRLTRRVNAARGPHPGPPPVGQTTIYDCFRTGRKRLDVDLVVEIAAALGLDDTRLARLRRAILHVLDTAGSAAVADVSGTLPAPAPRFTGRAAAQRAIAEHLSDAGPVLVITGPAGVGKTELAVKVAEQLFAPVRLFADLHGFDLERPPTPADAVLTGLLGLLGVPDERIHGGRDKAALFRAGLRGRKAVLILDNAAGPHQVAPLLPAGPDCVVLVTSRLRFPEADGIVALELGPLEPAEAVELLRAYDPYHRVDSDPGTARRLATDLCGGLPLELAALGAQLADPDEARWSLADHAARLAALPRDEISRPALTASYRRLPGEIQRVFRLLSLHPGADLTAYDTAALAGLPLETARAALTGLTARHLLSARHTGRYRFHDAIHAYAHRLLRRTDPASDQAAAFAGLLALQRYAAATAMDSYAPHTAADRPAADAPGGPVPAMTTEAEAIAWLDAEFANLVTTALRAADGGGLEHAGTVSGTLTYYLYHSGRWSAAVALHTCASRIEDPPRRAGALTSLSVVYRDQGRHQDAAEALRAGLVLHRQTGNRYGEAAALTGLGNVAQLTGHHDQAIEHQRGALRIYREIGNEIGECHALTNLGIVYATLHDDGQARALTRPLDSPADLGHAHGRLGRHDAALDCLEQALALARRTGNRYGEANALRFLGTVHAAAGEREAALEHCRQAVEIARRFGHRKLHCQALNDIGDHDPGDPRALPHYHAARELAAELGDLIEQARALDGIGRVRHGRGETAEAVAAWREAWELVRDLRVPEAAEIAARLARAAGEPPGP